MRKVFYRCDESSGVIRFTEGKEYEECGGVVVADDGFNWAACLLDNNELFSAKFTRIERECFEAAGQTWFKHTPGDPMPCSAEALVSVKTKYGKAINGKAIDMDWGGDERFCMPIIGWRYHEPEVLEPVADTAAACCDAETPDQFHSFAWLDFLQAVGHDVAAVNDDSLPTRQRSFVNGKEEAFSEKQKLQDQAEQDAAKQHADALTEAARAMDKVGQDFNHKLGWAV